VFQTWSGLPEACSDSFCLFPADTLSITLLCVGNQMVSSFFTLRVISLYGRESLFAPM
jgi:hypothetical protein